MLRVLASAGVAGMQGAVSSPLIVAPGVTGGFTGKPTGAGGLGLLLLGITKTVSISTQRLPLCDEVWAGPVTRFPELQTVLPAPEKSMILCAEVTAGDFRDAVVIADSSICNHTRTVHLGGAHCSILVGGT